MTDGIIIKDRRYGPRANGATPRQTIGYSRGGLTRKILALAGALGNLIDLRLHVTITRANGGI
jgi:hypothetical protein